MQNGECLVAHVIDSDELVINRGNNSGIKIGQRFQIYELGDEIVDPETQKSLGRLEIVKGTGSVIHIQDQISTIHSDMVTSPKRVIRKQGPTFFGMSTVEEESMQGTEISFSKPKIGDIARPI